MICLCLISLTLTTKAKATNNDVILNQGQPAPFSGVLSDPITYRQNSLYKLEALDFKNNLNSYVKCIPIDDSSTRLFSGSGIAVILGIFILGALAEGIATHQL